MTVEETLRAMLDGWTEDKWFQGDTRGPSGSLCLYGRFCQVSRPATHYIDWRFLDEVVVQQWPDRVGDSVDSTGVTVLFNDHPDTTFADVVALVEKAAAVAAERGL